MKPFRITSGIASFALFVSSSFAASIVVNIDSGDKEFRNFSDSTVLTAGAKNGANQIADHDGALIQLGYFSNATSADLFSGTWIPLSGEGSAGFTGPNLNFRTTIGDNRDNGVGDGQFATQLLFTDANPSSFQNLPTPGRPLAIRVYDGLTLATSTRFETISSNISGWLWRAPGDPQPVSIDLSLFDSGLRLQSTNAAPAANGQIRTVTPVPEPSSLLLLSIGALVSLKRRRS